MVQQGLTPGARREAVALLERMLAEVAAGRLDADRAGSVLAAVAEPCLDSARLASRSAIRRTGDDR